MRFLPLLLTVFSFSLFGNVSSASAVPLAFENAGAIAGSNLSVSFSEFAHLDVIVSDAGNGIAAANYDISQVKTEPAIDELSPALLFLASFIVSAQPVGASMSSAGLKIHPE
tara:strand:+ start:1095 stop:1430 length:336 start_codon:yes stop_codon:yes gene_type:complete